MPVSPLLSTRHVSSSLLRRFVAVLEDDAPEADGLGIVYARACGGRWFGSWDSVGSSGDDV